MTRKNIEQIAISYLKPWAKNARTHSRKQIRQIADSIERFGFTNPVLIDGAGTILAGHGRVAAADVLGMAVVPCLRIADMTEVEKRAYVLADNKLALNAGWDEDLLAQELGALLESPDLDFDIGLTGFTIAEIDSLIEAEAPEEPGDPADDVLVAEARRRVETGDVWQLGPHRLICGDALDPETVSLLMDGEAARMAFSDPPYNVPIDGHVGNSGKTQHREFAVAAGQMSQDQFTAFLAQAFENMAAVSADGAIHFLCMDWRHMGEMLAAGQGVDMIEGTATIIGPATKEEKAEFDWMVNRRETWAEELQQALEEREKAVDPGMIRILDEDIDLARRVLATIDKILGPEDPDTARLKIIETVKAGTTK